MLFRSAVTPYAISSALIREEGRVQKPVYYTSKALRGAEGRYPLIEELTFALITSSRKLRHYFQAHVINVMTDHTLKKTMNPRNFPDATPKAHLLGFNFILYCLSVLNVSCRSSKCFPSSRLFTNMSST